MISRWRRRSSWWWRVIGKSVSNAETNKKKNCGTKLDAIQIGWHHLRWFRRVVLHEVKSRRQSIRTLKPEKDGLFQEQYSFLTQKDWECHCQVNIKTSVRKVLSGDLWCEIYKIQCQRAYKYMSWQLRFPHIWYLWIPSRKGLIPIYSRTWACALFRFILCWWEILAYKSMSSE